MQLLEMKPRGEDDCVIVVAVKLNAKCREMLTWILSKVAQCGDKVVAVHVVRSSGDASQDFVLDPNTKRKMDYVFESVLGIYQSICNLKQVRLDIKVVPGTSLRKSLVEVANLEKASKLVLLGSKHDCEVVAKHCLKHLSVGTFVLIVEQGQIVYLKEAAEYSWDLKKGSVGNTAHRHMKVYGQSKSDRAIDYAINSNEKQQPGWPLMHRSISLEKASSPRNISVVKWAMQLPDRLRVVFDKQGGRMVASSAIVPRLKSGTEMPTSSPAAHLAMIKAPGVAEAPQVSFFQRLAHLCRNTPCVRFTHGELHEATAGFSQANLVGRGGYSKVYRGTLSDGRVVAVKCLKEEADDELLTEVEILLCLNHPHIVSLLGYYADTQTHILVYNYSPGGNLEENLHDKKRNCLSWEARHKIAIGAAEALVYLHDTCPRPVIHRDVKSSNILLSSNFRPKVSDFGLAKWASTSATHITCNDVVGTLGYLAPEYFMFGRVNDKTDVFAFGVVLLEIITGRSPIDMSKSKGEENLVSWARPYLSSGHTELLVDPRLEERYNEEQVNNMIAAASFCIRQSPQYRPRMTRVLRMIRGEDNFCTSGRYDLGDEYEFLVEPETNDVRKHLALAMMGVDDDVASQSSADQSSIDFISSHKSLVDYFGDRYSRSNSFDS